MSNHPNVMAFNQSLPANGLAMFVQQASDSCRREIFRLKNDRTANERNVQMIFVDCMEIILRQVEPTLEKILGSQMVKVQVDYPLNGASTDLGIKYKDTDLYKRYIDLIDGSKPAQRLRTLYKFNQEPTTDSDAVEHTANTAQADASLVETDSTGSYVSDLEEITPVNASFPPVGSSTVDLFSPIQSKEPSVNLSSGVSIRTARKQGPNKLDNALVAYVSEDSNDNMGPNQLATSIAKVEFIPEKEIKGTVLACPSEGDEVGEVQVQAREQQDQDQGGDGRTVLGVIGLGTTSSGLSATDQGLPVPLSAEARRALQELIAQGIWNLCNLGAMTSSASRGPIPGLLILNRWFVRMIADSSSWVVNFETEPGQAPSETTMLELLKWFQMGRFPHRISTRSGMEKLYEWTLAGFRAFVLPAILKSEADLKRKVAVQKRSRSKRRKTINKPESKPQPDESDTSPSSSDDEADPRSSDFATSQTEQSEVGDEAGASQNTPNEPRDEEPLEDCVSDSHEYGEYKTILQQMDFLDGLGWQVRCRSTEMFDALL